MCGTHDGINVFRTKVNLNSLEGVHQRTVYSGVHTRICISVNSCTDTLARRVSPTPRCAPLHIARARATVYARVGVYHHGRKKASTCGFYEDNISAYEA